MNRNLLIKITSIASVALSALSLPKAVSAGECEGILGYLHDKSESSASGKHYSSYDRFFCSNEYSSYKQARDSGAKVGIPIDGVPVEFGGHDRNSNWNSYKKALCEAIRTDTFSSNDIRLKIQKGNEAAIDAWKSCVTSTGLHFFAESDSPDAAQFVLIARYNPDGPQHSTKANGAVTFQPNGQVVCDGDTIKEGTLIGPGGRVLNCRRISKSPVTIALSTQNGPGVVKFPAISNELPGCGTPTTRVFSATSGKAPHPRVEVNVDQGYKIVGGGARANWSGGGSLLTASYPETQHKWVATSKDHSVSDPSTITAWAITIYDPNDQWDVEYVSNTGNSAPHPVSRATLPPGYIMTGGGARVNWNGAGNLLTASYPVDAITWEARSKDHPISSPANITAYVIGMKPNRCVSNMQSKILSSNSVSAPHPTGIIQLPPGLVLTGGGAIVNWNGAGNLLTASYPKNDNTWEVRSKDHSISSPASITAYAIGIPR